MANVKQIKQKTTGTLLDIEDTQARSDIAAEVVNRTNANNELQEKINTNKNDIGKLKGDLGELDTRLSESINDITKNFEIVGISPNVVDMTKIKRGEYIHTNGQNVSNKKYLHTDFIPVKTGDKIESWRYTGSRWTQNSYNMRYVCAYGAEKM